jgi:hypothetical protein
MALSATQKEFLAFAARHADKAERRERYCELGLGPADAHQGTVGTSIYALLEHPDAIVFLEQQRAELERSRTDAMNAADGAAWNREKAQAELDQALFEMMTAKAKDQVAKIKADDPKAKADNSTAIGNLAKAGVSMTSQTGGRKVMTPEERRQKAKEAGINLEGEAEQQWPPEHVAEVKAS